MFHRKAVEDLQSWYNGKNRKPLVIRGARQVGKTTAVRLAAESLSVPLVEINLERHPDLEPLFRSYRVEDLLFSISLITGQEITRSSRAILFFDEAQAIPATYSCLRYFHEDMPELAVVLTGSLLDQALHDYQFPYPVGRVEQYFMSPFTFMEFLTATEERKAIDVLEQLTWKNVHLLSDQVHGYLLSTVRRYTLTGGMPYCIQIAVDNQFIHAEIVRHQAQLIQAYKDDFSKYSGSQTALKLGAFFDALLSQVGLQFSHKQANEIASSTSGDNRQLNAAIERFVEARLFFRVVHTSANHIPLGADVKIRISKFLFIDTGLLLAAQGIPVQQIMNSPLELTNRGVISEQFVGQQLLGAKPGYVAPSLYYWHPPKAEGQAEIDFLYEHDNRIYPVEVKSGSRGSIKSIHSYVIKKQADCAIRISSAKPSIDNLVAKVRGQERAFRLLNLPFYLLNHLDRMLAFPATEV